MDRRALCLSDVRRPLSLGHHLSDTGNMLPRTEPPPCHASAWGCLSALKAHTLQGLPFGSGGYVVLWCVVVRCVVAGRRAGGRESRSAGDSEGTEAPILNCTLLRTNLLFSLLGRYCEERPRICSRTLMGGTVLSGRQPATFYVC